MPGHNICLNKGEFNMTFVNCVHRVILDYFNKEIDLNTLSFYSISFV